MGKININLDLIDEEVETLKSIEPSYNNLIRSNNTVIEGLNNAWKTESGIKVVKQLTSFNKSIYNDYQEIVNYILLLEKTTSAFDEDEETFKEKMNELNKVIGADKYDV